MGRVRECERAGAARRAATCKAWCVQCGSGRGGKRSRRQGGKQALQQQQHAAGGSHLAHHPPQEDAPQRQAVHAAALGGRVYVPLAVARGGVGELCVGGGGGRGQREGSGSVGVQPACLPACFSRQRAPEECCCACNWDSHARPQARAQSHTRPQAPTRLHPPTRPPKHAHTLSKYRRRCSSRVAAMGGSTRLMAGGSS